LKKNIALAMIKINQSKIGNKLKIKANENEINCTVVEKPFFDPRKKIASS
jgi:aminomethyltransferase